MKRDHSSDDFEKDPVWELLRESAAQRPSPSFAANVVRAARLEPPAKPWWSRLLIPASVGGVLAASAAVVTVMFTLHSNPTGVQKATNTPADSSLAVLQDDFNAEVLIAASDHLADYSDEELIAMIGL